MSNLITNRLAYMIGKKFERELSKIHHEKNPDLITRKSKTPEYHCIHLDVESFMEYMSAVDKFSTKALEDLHFVDVGCGVGQKLVLAASFGFKKITGIEITTEYINAAREIVPSFLDDYKQKIELNIMHSDACKVSYKDFDVIYFYKPLRANSKQKVLESRIVKTAKKGAIIIGVYEVSLYSKYRTNNQLMHFSIDNGHYNLHLYVKN